MVVRIELNSPVFNFVELNSTGRVVVSVLQLQNDEMVCRVECYGDDMELFSVGTRQ